jgi:hypothetical protein
MTTARDQWRRVSRGKPCPVCERPDWCLVSTDGTAAICARVESPKRCGEAGWLHRLTDAPWRPARRIVRTVPLRHDDAGLPDFTALSRRCQLAVDPGRLHQFARSLGLSADSLSSLAIGWSADQRAWSFPMRNATGVVVGIRLRRPSGFKFAVTGSKEGLFLPAGALDSAGGRLLVCEGPTDTAALLDLGFLAVVGRPSCTGGIKLLVEMARRRPSEIVVVADGDEPGQRGADALASILAAYVPAVRVITPPTGIKDARAWKRAGATRQELEQLIVASAVRRLTVRTAARKG